MIDFRSDTVTRPTAAMQAAMQRAPLGDDVFGDDPSVNRLQREAADMLGFEAALFAPSGTQTNLIALMSQCQRGDEAIVGQMWHTYRWEGGGMAVLGSIQPQPVENQSDGTLRVADIAAAIKPDDPHFARSRLIGLENTTGGKVLPLNYLAEVGALASAHGLAMHLDGARLFNAAVVIAEREADPWPDANSKPNTLVSANSVNVSHTAIITAARSICSHFDTVSVCLSKGLGAPIGSLILGRADVIARGRRIRKMLGGGMRQAGFLAAAGSHALEHHLERLAEDHRHARRLASGLREIAAKEGPLNGRLSVVEPDTNIVFVDIAADLGEPFQAHLAGESIGVTGGRYFGGLRLRWVTHLDIGADDVERALASVARYRG